MHTSTLLTTAILAASALAAPTELSKRQDDSVAENQSIVQALELATTAVDRVNMLSPQDFVYDFKNPPANATTQGEGGMTVKSDRNTFPALIGTGVSMTVGFISPCGFNTPHTHPRSSEINIITQGRLGTFFVTENGANPVGVNYLSEMQMTVFPQGAMHMEFNPDCEAAVFVAGFASEDPGVQQMAQTLFEIPSDLLQADLGVRTLNGEQVSTFAANLPPNVATGIESCLRKCGLKGELTNQ